MPYQTLLPRSLAMRNCLKTTHNPWIWLSWLVMS